MLLLLVTVAVHVVVFEQLMTLATERAIVIFAKRPVAPMTGRTRVPKTMKPTCFPGQRLQLKPMFSRWQQRAERTASTRTTIEVQSKRRRLRLALRNEQ